MIESEISKLISYRVVWMQSQELVPNHEASMSKMFGSELGQRVARFGVNMMGLHSQRIDPDDPDAPLAARIGRSYMSSVPSTIAAGTSEIQRNIIATQRSAASAAVGTVSVWLRALEQVADVLADVADGDALKHVQQSALDATG